MKEFDNLLFQWMAGGADPNAVVLSIAAAFAQGGAWAAACVLAAAAWFHPRARLYLLGAIVASSLVAMLSHSLAASIGWPRPFTLGLSPAWIAKGPSGSLPSTHAAVMATMAFICLGRRELQVQGYAIAALTLLTGWGRIYTGVHFPLDIAAGIGLGLVIAGLFQGVRRTVAPAIARLANGLLRAGPVAADVPAMQFAGPADAGSADAGSVGGETRARDQSRAQSRAQSQSQSRARVRPPVATSRPRQSLSVVIPCFNEGANLHELLFHLEDILMSLHSPWEVIVVDDGSTDNTAAVARAWCDSPGFQLIGLSRNFGKEAAMTAGLKAARGDAVVLLDGDLQHSPDLIAQMVNRWRAGADMVYAVRQDRAEQGALRELASRMFYRLVNTSGRYHLPRDAGDFRLMDRCVVDALLALPERTRFMKGLYAWVGFESVALPYTPLPRAAGESRFGGLRLLAMALDGITAFTTWPLRAVSISGAVMAVCAFTYGTYLVVDHWMVGNPVSGWTTIVVSLMFFAGIQLISTGILGEYIGRIFDEVKGRPLYVIRGQVGTGLDEASQ